MRVNEKIADDPCVSCVQDLEDLFILILNLKVLSTEQSQFKTIRNELAGYIQVQPEVKRQFRQLML
ncbi:hypothetical protein VIAQ111709_14215 [Vibrio aquimaris]|uniref:Uncharacterized protein n=1 Tax=Vibrio aquimaris TaxID=2587862 RepID=A0A5P9CSW1_9VIBR|nr:hypothetical protein FIV01_20385 [Vibrio aquimaris]